MLPWWEPRVVHLFLLESVVVQLFHALTILRIAFRQRHVSVYICFCVSLLNPCGVLLFHHLEFYCKVMYCKMRCSHCPASL